MHRLGWMGSDRLQFGSRRQQSGRLWGNRGTAWGVVIHRTVSAGVTACIVIAAVLGSQPALAAGASPARLSGLTAHMVLVGSRAIPAGSSLGGTLIVDNTTKAPISVNQGCAGQPEFGVVLTSSAVPQSPAFTAVRCPPIVLTPGVHRYPFVLSATYLGCTMQAGSGSSIEPACLMPGNGVPPLPPGQYRAVVSPMSPIPIAKPITVKVIEGPKHPSTSAQR